MKKFFAVAILALATLSMNAQDFKKFRFGPAAGMNISKIGAASSKIGFNIGARAEYNFSDNFYLGSGLLFTQKGFKETAEAQGYKATVKANPFYIEIPINAGYRYNFSEKFSLFGEVGPYIGIGIAGKYKETLETPTDTQSASVNFFPGGKRFDFGIGFAAGCEFSKFQVRVGYELGLTKVLGDGKNKNLFVGVAYMF